MFGDHRRLEKKLRRSGARGMANVTAAHVSMAETSGSGPELALDPNRTTRCWYHLDVNVTAETGETFSTSFRQLLDGGVSAGAELPVLFDPSDHDKICVDHDRLDAQGASGAGGLEVSVVSRSDGTVRRINPTQLAQQGGVIRIQTGGSETDTIGALERLSALKDKGVLTEAEFEAEKRKLLGA